MTEPLDNSLHRGVRIGRARDVPDDAAWNPHGCEQQERFPEFAHHNTVSLPVDPRETSTPERSSRSLSTTVHFRISAGPSVASDTSRLEGVSRHLSPDSSAPETRVRERGSVPSPGHNGEMRPHDREGERYLRE